MNRWSAREPIRKFFAIISKLGDGGFWAIFALLLIGVHGSAIAFDLLRIAVTALVGVGIYRSLKNRLVRERPYISLDGIICGAAPLDRYSFPSGHTMHAVAFSLQFLWLVPEFAWLSAPFAALVALSRVVLGLHYPSDVVVGALLGATLALISQSLVV